MNSHPRRRSLLGPTVALALVGLLVPVLALPASAAPAPNPNQPALQWAYGAERWVNASTVLPHGTYNANAFFGWNVIYTLTNTSNSTFEIEAQRTMGVSYSAQYCSPSCSQASATLGLKITGNERETGFVNFTVNGSVDEAGVATQALGLLNSHAVARGYLNESLSGSRTVAGATQSGSASLDVAAQAEAQIAFGSSLGLVPWNTMPGTTWNASAPYTASGSWGIDFTWASQGALTNGSGSANPSGAVNGSGTVAVAGADLANITLANGLNTSVVVLGWNGGPFDGVDGIILVPHAFEIFGAGARVFAGHAPGLQSVLTSRVDLFVDRAHHRVRFAAAAASYQGSDTLTTSSATAIGTTTDAAAVGPSAANVQAQPESVSAAQSQTCSFVGCGSSAPGGSDLRPLAFVAAGVVVVAVLGTVGTYQYRQRSRRRSSLPASEGSASQYPPPPSSSGFTPPLAGSGPANVPPEGPRSPRN